MSRLGWERPLSMKLTCHRHRGLAPDLVLRGRNARRHALSTFTMHTLDSAPPESVPALRTLEQGLGFVPNLAATMAESSVLITGFVDLRKTLAGSDLTGVEREIVALAVSLENDCDYYMETTTSSSACW